MIAPAIRRRSPVAADEAWPADLHTLLARLYAARGVRPADAARSRLADLALPSALGGVERACTVLADAIAAQRRICVVGDFDADGATGTAVAVRGLRLLGARNVAYRVPNRFRDGYGLSPGLVEALADTADLILTVDNGIASHAGVAAARARGISVVITDHHLPGDVLPAADAIVNPNAVPVERCVHGMPACPGCGEHAHAATGTLAGVGVVFYLLLALRARLHPDDHRAGEDRDAAAGDRTPQADRPDLSALLDLVALGTVADLVPLGANNRILVAAGLRRIRSGRCSAGIAALCGAAGRDPARLVAGDLAFALAPRINAAGRLDDMSLGIECLLADDPVRAGTLAAELSALNVERRQLQAAMVGQAEAMIAAVLARESAGPIPDGVVLHDQAWHAGVVGLVASRLKERFNRPVVAFAPADADSGDREGNAAMLRGSARSIAGFHLRDALAEIDARCPGLIERFGGHAMAAGLTIQRDSLPRFALEFAAVATRRIDATAFEHCIWSDGELDPAHFTTDIARLLRYAAPWGQGFPEPAFDDVFTLDSWRVVGERHLKMRLRLDGCREPLEAIQFNAEAAPPPPRLRAVYQLDLDEWNGRERLQLLVRHIEVA